MSLPDSLHFQSSDFPIKRSRRHEIGSQQQSKILVSNHQNKKIIKYEANFDYESVFKNTDSSNEIKNEEIIDKEVSDKNIVNVGLYGEMFIETTRNNHAGKININSNQIAFYSHRSGWDYVVHNLSEFNNPNGIYFDGFIENAFSWRKNQYIEDKIIPYREPWIGFLHNPPNMPLWFSDNNSYPQTLLNDELFKELFSDAGNSNKR